MDAPVLDVTAVERLLRLGGRPLVRQLIESYLAHGPERIATLMAGAEAADAVQVERSAHTLKASAGNVGAVQLQHTAGAVEAQAGAGIVDAVLIDQLRQQYDRSETELRRILRESTP